MKNLLVFLCALLAATPLYALELQGKAIQGGLMFGTTAPGTRITLDEIQVPVSEEGYFVIGFGRNETGTKLLKLAAADGTIQSRALQISAREYAVERVDGLPPQTVTPDLAAAEGIRMEALMGRNARLRRDNRTGYTSGFAWPAVGRISGVYGSQRVLNGEPGRPHYGLDIAAPTGTLVTAPADGIITLAHPNMYFSGGIIVLDHGQGLSSSFLHLSAILVEAGVTVKQGDKIGRIGATGRASGPHLDWRMNWMNRRVDPRPLLPATAELPVGSGPAN